MIYDAISLLMAGPGENNDGSDVERGLEAFAQATEATSRDVARLEQRLFDKPPPRSLPHRRGRVLAASLAVAGSAAIALLIFLSWEPPKPSSTFRGPPEKVMKKTVHGTTGSAEAVDDSDGEHTLSSAAAPAEGPPRSASLRIVARRHLTAEGLRAQKELIVKSAGGCAVTHFELYTTRFGRVERVRVPGAEASKAACLERRLRGLRLLPEDSLRAGTHGGGSAELIIE